MCLSLFNPFLSPARQPGRRAESYHGFAYCQPGYLTDRRSKSKVLVSTALRGFLSINQGHWLFHFFGCLQKIWKKRQDLFCLKSFVFSITNRVSAWEELWNWRGNGESKNLTFREMGKWVALFILLFSKWERKTENDDDFISVASFFENQCSRRIMPEKVMSLPICRYIIYFADTRDGYF